MAKINLSAPPAFGFETNQVNALFERTHVFGPSRARKYQVISNCLKVVSYIPIIGTVVGVYKFVSIYFTYSPFTLSRLNMISSNHRFLCLSRHTVRAGIETLSLGVVFLPIDIITTIARNVRKSKTQETKEEKTIHKNQRKKLESNRKELSKIKEECISNNLNDYFVRVLIELNKKDNLLFFETLFHKKTNDCREYKINNVTLHLHLEELAMPSYKDFFEQYVLSQTSLFIELYNKAKETNRVDDFINALPKKTEHCLDADMRTIDDWAQKNLTDRPSFATLFQAACLSKNNNKEAVIDELIDKTYWNGDTAHVITRDEIVKFGVDLYIWDED